MSKLYYSEEDALKKDVDGGVSREVLARSGPLMLVRVAFEKDAIGALHKHPHEQSAYVLDGEFLFTIGEEEFHCKKGDSVYLPPEVLHGCKCIEQGHLLDIFTPIREDFLEQ